MSKRRQLLLVALGLTALAWTQFSAMSPASNWAADIVHAGVDQYRRATAEPLCDQLDLTNRVAVDGIQLTYPACFEVRDQDYPHYGIVVDAPSNPLAFYYLSVVPFKRADGRARDVGNRQPRSELRYSSLVNGWEIEATQSQELSPDDGRYLSYSIRLVSDRGMVLMGAATEEHMIGTRIADRYLQLFDAMALRLAARNPSQYSVTDVPPQA